MSDPDHEPTQPPVPRDAEATVVTPRRPGAPAPAIPGRYQITGELGRGGMGEVLEAFDPLLRRRVALKRTSGDRALDARFVEEAQVTAQLDHPHIVPVHELASDEQGRPYYTMKQVRGRTLGRLIADGEPLPRLLRIFARVCEAVAFAHSRGVLHRDLKPDNVMAGAFGEVYVMDWGLATMRNAAGGMRNRGSVLGTPAYLPPEQAGNGEPTTEKSDVFLLGGVLYEILSGTPPRLFDDRPDLERLRSTAIEPASRRARGVPPELEAIAMRALELDPSRRYATVGQLSADLEAYLDGRLVGAARYSLAAVAWKLLRRHRYLAGGCAAVLVTAALAAGLFAARRAREREDARRAVQALAPARRLEAARKVVEALPADAAERRSPSPGEKARLGRMLAGLQRLVAACSHWQRLAPGSPDARRGLLESLFVLGRLALVSEDYALAQFAFDQATGLAPESGRARGLAASVAGERRAAIERHKRDADRVLAAASRQRLHREDDVAYRRTMALLLRWREPELAAHLRRRLDELGALLRRAAHQAIVAAGSAAASEAVRRWLAWAAIPVPGEPAAPAPSAADTRLVREALLRLELGARKGLARDARGKSWRTLVAEAQTVALGEREIEPALLCDTLLGLGPDPASYAALARYLGAEWDPARALPAGLALAAFARDRLALRAVLEGLVGLRAGEDRPWRWDINGRWWRQVARELGRTATGTGAAPNTAQEFNLRGLARAARGDLDGAISDYTRALALDPRFAVVYNNRGAARRASGDLDGAIADCTRAIEFDPAHPAAYSNRGSARQSQGDLAGALSDYDRALELDPRFAMAYVNRGLARQSKGDLAGAIADHTRAVELDPKLATAYVNRGQARQEQGDLEGALADYTRALALDPKLAAAYSRRARARQRKGDLAGALADYGRAIALDPDASTHNNRGLAHLDQGDHEAAIADFSRAIALDPRFAVAYGNRGHVRRARGDLAGAIADLTQAIALDPKLAMAYNNRGKARGARGDLDGAYSDYSRSIAIDPKNARAYNNRGVVRRARGDLAGAIADFTRAIALDAKYARAYSNRGNTRQAGGDLAGAIADQTRAIALDPGLAIAWNNRGLARRAKGDHDGAISDLTRAIALDPKFAIAHYNRGNARAARRDHAGAISDYSRAIALAPRYAEAYHSRGHARGQSGDLAGAIADFSRAIEIDPKHARACKSRGDARRARGDLAGAIADYGRAMALDPKLASACVARGDARRVRGDLAGAIADYTRALALAPGDALAHHGRGNARQAKGDLAGASEDYARAVALRPSFWQAWGSLGLLRARRGRREEAIAALEQARALAPPEVKPRIAELLARVRGKR